jgi:putative FmdB family regulatory protein
MPTYEYVCDACGNELEEFQSFSEKPLKKCPACRKPKLRRKFGTGAAVLFKGSGFYQTDYRSESYKAAAKADEGKSSDTGGKNGTTGKSESSGKETSAPAPKSSGKTSKSAASVSDD